MENAITLFTERTFSRLLTKEDYTDILEMFKDNEAFQYIPHLLNQNEEYYTNYLDGKYMGNESGKGYYWVSRFRKNNELVGCLNVTPVGQDDDRIQIGWIIRREYWRQGLAAELAKEIFRYSSQDLKLPVIYGFFDKKNIASEKIFKKLAFDFYEVDDEGTVVYRYLKS